MAIARRRWQGCELEGFPPHDSDSEGPSPALAGPLAARGS